MEKEACIWNYFLKIVQKIYRISSLKCAYLKTHEYMVESIVDRQPLNWKALVLLNSLFVFFTNLFSICIFSWEKKHVSLCCVISKCIIISRYSIVFCKISFVLNNICIIWFPFVFYTLWFVCVCCIRGFHWRIILILNPTGSDFRETTVGFCLRIHGMQENTS